MRASDLILKKRNGGSLKREEIKYLLDCYLEEQIPDYQMSAFLMAVYFKGMNENEMADFTLAMAQSGELIDLSSVPGIKVDKHSTGGVGDKTTLVVGPLVAAAGIPVAKISGRGLGHTGGTLDKLSCIEGFRTELSGDKFIENIKANNLAITGQTADLVPADRRLYALRDVTATVDSIPLIASSIMSKKYASGADALMLDVKTGKGAFMKTREEAVNLAQSMVKIGNVLGLKTGALITDMNQPLGKMVGNSLEVKEAVMTLKGQGPDDLTELCLTLGSYMLVLGEKAGSPVEGKKKIKEALFSGTGLEKFKVFIEAQGGSSEIINNFGKLPQAVLIKEFQSPSEGFIREIDAFKIGKAAMVLGAGRGKKEDSIDSAVGIELNKKVGDWVSKGEPLFIIHSNHPSKTVQAAEILSGAFLLGKKSPEGKPLIYDIIFPE